MLHSSAPPPPPHPRNGECWVTVWEYWRFITRMLGTLRQCKRNAAGASECMRASEEYDDSVEKVRRRVLECWRVLKGIQWECRMERECRCVGEFWRSIIESPWVFRSVEQVQWRVLTGIQCECRKSEIESVGVSESVEKVRCRVPECCRVSKGIQWLS